MLTHFDTCNIFFKLSILAIATPGIPCEDNIPHCDIYDVTICTTNPTWALDNCRAYCTNCTPSGENIC